MDFVKKKKRHKRTTGFGRVATNVFGRVLEESNAGLECRPGQIRSFLRAHVTLRSRAYSYVSVISPTGTGHKTRRSNYVTRAGGSRGVQ